MHQINIANRIIENRFEMYKNDIILRNLLFMRPTIDIQCPESFKNKQKRNSNPKNGIFLYNKIYIK